MALTQKVKVSVANFGTVPVIHAVEGDTGREVETEFLDLTLTSSMTAELWYLRTDGVRGHVAGTVDDSTNTVTAEIDDAITKAGQVPVQIKVTDSGELVSCFAFLIIVQSNN